MKKEAGEGRGIGLAAVYKLEKLPFANPARGRGAMLAEWAQWDLNRGKVLGILESQDNTYRLLGAGTAGSWRFLTSGPCRGPHGESTHYMDWTDTYLPTLKLKPKQKWKLRRDRQSLCHPISVSVCYSRYHWLGSTLLRELDIANETLRGWRSYPSRGTCQGLLAGASLFSQDTDSRV